MAALKSISLFAAAALMAACASNAPQELGDGKSGSIIGVNRNSNLEISDVLPKYVEDYETRTIWEALTGDEFTHGYLVMRSQPESREGMYFFVMLPWSVSEISTGTIIELEVDSTATAKTRKFTFKVPETSSVVREIKLGLTGLDWKGKSERVNAWKIAIKTPAGNTIAEKQSWLWAVKH
ncbi:MAG: hypothetical protein J6P03_06770 [Opitutales bacterium]|nr:hypothetical protein [Opitutales bacterium]